MVPRTHLAGLRCHNDAGNQFTSIGYGERLAEIGAVPSIGTAADCLLTARNRQRLLQVRTHHGPARPARWKTVADVELATLGCVHWHNTTRLHGDLDDVPPTEFEGKVLRSQTDRPTPGQNPIAQSPSEPGFPLCLSSLKGRGSVNTLVDQWFCWFSASGRAAPGKDRGQDEARAA